MASMRTVAVLFVLAGCLLGTFAAHSESIGARDAGAAAAYFDGQDSGAYLNWLGNVKNNYERSTFLASPEGPSTGAAIHWTIQDDTLHLAVAARATGWVSFGIAESGGMAGADVVSWTGAGKLTDGYILDDRVVRVDDCQSWTLVNSTIDGGFMIFEVTRLLDTGDSQDRAIVDDSSWQVEEHRVIAAWGNDGATVNNHGPNQRVRSALRFHGDAFNAADFSRDMEAQSEGVLNLLAEDYPIKLNDTEYAHFCFSKDNLVQQGMPEDTELHVVGIEPIVDPRAVKYVHHFVVIGLVDDGNNVTDCDNVDGIEIVYGWAPGNVPLALPPNVGGPLGKGGFSSFQLQIHYNNPWLDPGILDSSGVRMYYTSKKREYEMGVAILGDPLVSLRGQPVGNGLVQHAFDCPGACSSFVLGGTNQSITVLRESLHMHQSGTSMYNYQIRDGEVIHVGSVEHWAFEQQGLFTIPQEGYEIMPGDSFRTECYFNSQNGETFGQSSQEEMCMTFLYYYPRVSVDMGDGSQFPFVCGPGLGICDSEWESTELTSTDELKRTFGTAMDTCPGESTVASTSSSSVCGGMLALVVSFLAAVYSF